MSSFGSALAASALFALVTAQANNIGVVTEPCLPRAAPTQSFTPNCAKNACQYASISSKGQCITSAGFLDELYLSTCDPSNANQSFVPNADGSVSAVGSPGNCWNVDGGSGEPSGTPIILYSCGSLPEGKLQPNDIFTFLTGGQIYANGSSLCLDVTPPPHQWTFLPGQLQGPQVLPSASYALADAQALCLNTTGCNGITYQGPLNPENNQTYSFITGTSPSKNSGWYTYLACGVYAPC